MMIRETKYIFLRLMLVIPRIYKRYTLSPHFSLKKINIDKWQKRLICLTRRTMFTEALKLALDYGLILEKNHGIIEFNQEAWSNPYIDMNTELTKKAQKLFWERLLQANKQFCVWKCFENTRNHRDFVVTIKKEISLHQSLTTIK